MVYPTGNKELHLSGGHLKTIINLPINNFPFYYLHAVEIQNNVRNKILLPVSVDFSDLLPSLSKTMLFGLCFLFMMSLKILK